MSINTKHLIQVILIILIGVQFLILPAKYSFFADDQKNQLIILIGLGIVLGLLRFRKKNDSSSHSLIVSKTPATLFIGLFCILIPLSSIWASHISLIWPAYIAWSVCFLVFVVGFSLNETIINKPILPIAILLIITVNVIQLYVSYINLLIQLDWQLTLRDVEKNIKYFGTNTNFLGSIILLYIPLLLELGFKRWKKVLVFINIFLIASLLPIFNSRAVTLTFAILAVFYLWRSVKEKYLIKFLGLSISIAFASTLYYQSFITEKAEFVKTYNFSRSIIENTRDNRIEIWKKSLILFTEKPILGHGAGNWKTEIQKYGSHDLFNGQQYYHAHNIVLEIIVELGLVGFLLLGGFFSYVLIQCIRFSKWHVLILFLCLLSLCLFYGIYLYGTNNMSLYLILASALSGVTLRCMTNTSTIKIPISICLIVIASCVYLNHSIGAFEKYYAHFNKAPKDVINSKIAKWDDYYNPYIHSYSNRTSTLNYKSRQLWKAGNRKQAIEVNEEAVSEYPYDRKLLVNLCSQYVATKKYKEGNECYENVLQLYDKSIAASLGLCRIGYRTNNQTIFNKGVELYHKVLIPSFEANYADEYLVGRERNIARYWLIRCNEIDNFQRLIDLMQTKSLKLNKSNDIR